jgi:hypothetical protein
MSPATRTLSKLRSDGWMADICERFITAGANRSFGNRKDLFNLFDIVAMRPDDGIMGVQCFTTAWTEHELKMSDNAVAVRTWLNSGGLIQLWGWRKLKLRRGSKAIRWTPKVKQMWMYDDGTINIEEITLQV